MNEGLLGMFYTGLLLIGIVRAEMNPGAQIGYGLVTSAIIGTAGYAGYAVGEKYLHDNPTKSSNETPMWGAIIGVGSGVVGLALLNKTYDLLSPARRTDRRIAREQAAARAIQEAGRIESRVNPMARFRTPEEAFAENAEKLRRETIQFEDAQAAAAGPRAVEELRQIRAWRNSAGTGLPEVWTYDAVTGRRLD